MNALFEKFALHNQHWESYDRFVSHDPHLKKLKTLKYIYEAQLLQTYPYHIPGIYLIGGGRQVGKTTFLKQSIQKLLSHNKFDNKDILFLTGEVIYSAEELRRILNTYLENRKTPSIIFVDEVNYIPDWDKAVKFIADSGLLDYCSLTLTGSDVIIMKDAMKRFPGRRGKASQTNFFYYSLSFCDYLKLKSCFPSSFFDEMTNTSFKAFIPKPIHEKNINILYEEFRKYLISGGYLIAINDLAQEGKILESSLMTYWEWIVGDILKHKKSENYLREVLNGILKRYTSPLSWNALSKDLSIDHHKTVSDYCDTLAQMDAIFILSALLEHKWASAPKKGKKIYFTDPFIHHAIHCRIQNIENPWQNYLEPLLTGEDEKLAPYVEAVVVTHFRRKQPVYYIKNHGEIDLATVHEKKVYPIEIKWTSQLRHKDLISISKYPQGIIAAKARKVSIIGENLVVPIPLLLLKINN